MPKNDELRKLPGVDTLMNDKSIKELLQSNSKEVTSWFIKQTLGQFRRNALDGKKIPPVEDIISEVKIQIENLTTKSLKPVINATGVIIHTNLGRAPFGSKLLEEVNEVLTGYNNLEFNLEKATRGTRYSHVTKLLKYLTNAEDILVVNNNAAAIMLVLRTFAKSREVIISRGELIEIGGSFRMPDIMSASDCKMIEVGTTNKTKVDDFENALNENTAILLKVHQSNYVIKGFTTEASLPELVKLGRKKKVPVIYDMGSGLLRKANIAFLKNEPDVRTTLATGVDLVTFSGDKLLGGPQAGIIAGKKNMIATLKKDPLTRALRVSKETLAMLETIALAYLDEQKLIALCPIFQMMTANESDLLKKAEKLKTLLEAGNIKTIVVHSEGQAGGGSLPEKRVKSYAITIEFPNASRNHKTEFAEKIFSQLLKSDKPVLGIIRKGKLLFDLLTVAENQLELASENIIRTYKEIVLK